MSGRADIWLRARPRLATTVAAVLLGAGALASAARAAETPVPLFDGATLTGWVQRGGQARYQVREGEIVGTAVPGTPNSFLCTEREYDDFVLELEFQVDPKLNSGVQIRSRVAERDETVRWTHEGEAKQRRIRAGRVHGYQVEIDPSPRAWSGGIYDEGRRGWLATLEDNPAARRAFRPDAWNHLRVEALGDRLRTWINGVPAADLRDAMTSRGFIALQVHDVRRQPEAVGSQVRWRNLWLLELSPPTPD